MTGRPMRMGLAGLGAASTDIIGALRASQDVELAAACEIRPDVRGLFAEQEGLPVFESVAEMAAADYIDAVYVATPNHLHCEHVLTVVEAGKDVLIEKPVALTLAECDRMHAAAKARNVRVLAGHTHSFDAPIVAMQKAIEEGLVGQVYMINQWYYTDWLYRGRAADELDVGKGGGVVYRQGPHGLDVIRLLAGRPARKVKASIAGHDFRGPTHGAFSAFIEFDGGISATAVFSGYSLFDSSELTFGLGELGCPRPSDTHAKARQLVNELAAKGQEQAYKASVSYGGKEAKRWQSSLHCPDDVRRHPFYGLTVVSGTEGDLRQSPDGLYRYSTDGREEIPVAHRPLERDAELRVLYEAWRDGVPLGGHDIAWARETLALCLAIIESADRGTEVPVEE